MVPHPDVQPELGAGNDVGGSSFPKVDEQAFTVPA